MTVHLAQRHRLAGCCPGACAKSVYQTDQVLIHDLAHPSLHAKKYDEAKDLWQARINDDWRFYFTIDRDTYRILDLMPHPK